MRVSALLLTASSTLSVNVLATIHQSDSEHASILARSQGELPFFPPPVANGGAINAHIARLCSMSLLSDEHCNTLNSRGSPRLSDAQSIAVLNGICNGLSGEDCSHFIADQSPKDTLVEAYRKYLEDDLREECDSKEQWACQMLGNVKHDRRQSPDDELESRDILTVFVKEICNNMPADACEGTLMETRNTQSHFNLTTELETVCNKFTGMHCKTLMQEGPGPGSTSEHIVWKTLLEGLPKACHIVDDACFAMKDFGMVDHVSRRQVSSSPLTSTTASALQPQTVIKTVTQTINQRCPFRDLDDPNESTVYMANFSGTTVAITAESQLIGPNTMAILAPKPMGTVFPILIDSDYLANLLRFSMDQQVLAESFQHVTGTPLHLLRAWYPRLDWDSVGRLGALLQENRRDLSMETALKHAIAFSLHSERSSPPQPTITASFNNEDATPGPIVSFKDTSFRMTQSTQTHDGDVFVAKTTSAPFDVHWAAQHLDQLPPACKKWWSHECRVQKCMLRHHKPINITTVFPAVLRQENPDHGVNLHIGYFTQRTSITTAHWGITEKEKIHYPSTTSWTTTTKDGFATPVQTMVRQTPMGLGFGIIKPAVIASNPECYDYDSCCEACALHPGEHHFFRWNNWMMWLSGFAMLAGLSLIGLLTLCCCAGFLRGRDHRKKDPTLSRWEAIPIIGHKFRSEKVDPNAGSEVAQVVEVVPVAAAAAGGAAAATAAEAGQSAGDGRGTLGRQAEEGRGRIVFADPGQAGQATAPATSVITEGGQAVPSSTAGQQVLTSSGTPTTVVTSPEGTVTGTGHDTAPQVRPDNVEAHRVDGAADAHSGSEVADMGSMRGRKRGRKDVKGLFNLSS